MKIKQSYINNKQDCFEDLDNAVSNGYSLKDMSVNDVYIELRDYSVGYEHISPSVLLAWIVEWKENHEV